MGRWISRESSNSMILNFSESFVSVTWWINNPGTELERCDRENSEVSSSLPHGLHTHLQVKTVLIGILERMLRMISEGKFEKTSS